MALSGINQTNLNNLLSTINSYNPSLASSFSNTTGTTSPTAPIPTAPVAQPTATPSLSTLTQSPTTTATQDYSKSPYAKYFQNTPAPLMSAYSGDEGGMYASIMQNNIERNNTFSNQFANTPISISVQELLKRNPEAAYFTPEVQKQFADNYRLGSISLSDAALYSPTLLPQSQGKINFLKNGKSNYSAVDPANLSKVYWDPNLGLQIDKKYVVDPVRNNLISTIAPIMASVVAPGIGTALGSALGIASPTISSAIAGAGLGGLTSGLSGGNALTGALTGGIGGAITGSGALDSILSSTNPITAGSNTMSNLGKLAGDITTDVMSGGTAAAGSGVSGAFNLSQLAQDPSSILHVGDLDSMLPGTSLSSGNSGITGLTQGGGGIGLTNAASTGGAVASDALGAGGTGALTAADGLGGLASSLGGGLVGTAGGVVPAATAAATSAANFSVPDFLSNLFNTGATNFMKDPLKNSTTLLGGLVSYLQGQGQAGDLSSLLKQGLSQSDPFGAQRAYYAQRLKDTYTNPVGVQKSPEYQAVHARELDALERADAAQGRRSQYGARAEKMDQNFMEYLNKERATLAGLAGSGISPSQVSDLTKTLGVGSSNAQINSTGQLLFALDRILNGK